jgi:hypothetical protein
MGMDMNSIVDENEYSCQKYEKIMLKFDKICKLWGFHGGNYEESRKIYTAPHPRRRHSSSTKYVVAVQIRGAFNLFSTISFFQINYFRLTISAFFLSFFLWES